MHDLIVIRRVVKQRQKASFNALTYGAIGLGSIGLGALYGRSYEFRRNQREWLQKHPRIQAGITGVLSPEAAIGNQLGKVFSRRRRTKKGKIIVEQVKR